MESIVKELDKNEIKYYVFTNSQDNQFIVVPEFGARILAVSVGGENLFWTHPDILEGQGGQRSWISPEGGPKGFLFKPDWSGNRDFSMMDPGHYKVTFFEENEHIVLENEFEATSNDGIEKYKLTITRDIRLKEDPLKDAPEFNGLNYEFLGIDFVHQLGNYSASMLDRILALWCLIQIPPGGTMIVPVSSVNQEAWRGNYFEPIPEEYVKANSDSFSFYIDGSKRYKVGIRAESAEGVICYLSRTKSKEYFLVSMFFPVRQDARYVDRPMSEQETNGDAIQLYSHLEKGALAFGELECHSWGLKIPSGMKKSFPVKIFIYKGSLDVIKKIGTKLVGSGFNSVYMFNEN
ncbi:MAG: DUF6786 family protein [Candidatus Aminicenantaceae bacterium]